MLVEDGRGWIGKGWEGEMRMKMRIMDVGGEGSWGECSGSGEDGRFKYQASGVVSYI